MSAYFFYQIFFCIYLVISFADAQHSIRNMFDLGSIGLPRKECLDTWFLSPYVGKDCEFMPGPSISTSSKNFCVNEANFIH